MSAVVAPSDRRPGRADAPAPPSAPGAAQYVAAAFVAGLATMVVEIASGRVLAPIMGVSLYSWTAIIGLVLAGLALGGWAGGWLADRRRPESVLVGGALASALGCLVAPLLADWAPSVRLVPTTEVIARTLWVAGAVLALPSLGLGAVVPPAARLVVRERAASGRAVGQLYAAGAAGSIAGVFLTGFLLIDLLGSRRCVALTGAAMLLVGLLVGRLWRGWSGRLAVLLLGLPLALSVSGRAGAWLVGPCNVESAYFCIQIIEEENVGGRLSRSVRLDRLTHGTIYVDDPTFLDFGYLRVMADLTDAFVAGRATMRALLIGGGSYSLPRYLEARFPGAEIEVIEIDPKVTRAATDFLGLRPDTRVRTANVDARQFFLERQPRGAYSVIYGDAFNDLSIPYHLTTREFAAGLRRALGPDGLYFANVIDVYQGGRFLRSFMATLRTEFAAVQLVVDLGTYDLIRPSDRAANAGTSGDPARDRRRTFVVVAGQRPIDFSRLDAVSHGSAFLVDPAEVDRYLADRRVVVLTDDHAPVDELVAPLFLSRPF
jgi:predicted membrane-bound spermidine synthase